MNQINYKLHVWPFLFQLKLQNIRSWRNWTGFWAGKVSFLLFFHFCLLLKLFALAPFFVSLLKAKIGGKDPLADMWKAFQNMPLA